MTRVAWAIAVGVMLTVGAGCYHPGPYAPNYGAYPTYPSAPPGSYPAAPGGSFVAPNQTVPGGTLGPMTTPYPTQSFPTQPYPTQQGPTVAPPLNGGGDAPPATFAPGSDPGGPVPNYDDPSAGDFGSAPAGDGFQAPAEGSPYMDEQGTALPKPSGYAGNPPASGTPDYFAGLSENAADPSANSGLGSSASGVQPAGYEDSVEKAFAGARPGPLGPAQQSGGGANSEWYGYDHKDYRWLRGVVDYDPATKEWAIIYGPIPEPGDRFGGQLTLGNHPSLSDFKNNDVVEVRGRVDPTAGKDRLGKPYFRVEQAKLLGRYE